MIGAESKGFARLAKVLALRAAQLAKAARENRALATRQDPGRWRRPDLLWPTFQEGR